MEIDAATRKRIGTVLPMLDESQGRRYLAAEAESLGRGGLTAVAALAGVSRATVSAGRRELDDPGSVPEGRVRREGAGRKPIERSQPGIAEALGRLVDAESYGDPEVPLRWTTKSLRRLAGELRSEGFSVSHAKVGQMLGSMGFSLQRNRKNLQVGEPHPDRDAQFAHISDRVAGMLAQGLPVAGVDCKKKELVGNFANGGGEWRPRGAPTQALDHDFELPGLGKAAPYGVYDVARNEAWVSVGVSADTAQFAVSALRAWWDQMGRARYDGASRLLVCCDGGGSNSSRSRLWKLELQGFCDRSGMEVEVCHLPPGTSKWNKVEHRLFAQISKNWRGRPLESLEVIVSLIAPATTSTGLEVRCAVDPATYERGIRVADEEMDAIDIVRDEFHGEWNYVIRPRPGLP